MMASSAATPMASSPLRRLRNAPLLAALGCISLGSAALAAPYVSFPSEDSLRQVQLAALACSRENTAASCEQARSQLNPLLDHPRLPATCKDLVWTLLQSVRPASRNSFERRDAIDDPASRLLLVCRSAEKPEPAPQAPAAAPSGFGGKR